MHSCQLAYESFCDDLWRDWLADRVPPSAFISKAIERDSAPEPWLEFQAGSHQLVVLTTNPGGGMKHQHRDRILSGESLIKPANGYRAATTALAPFYLTDPELGGTAARRRINAFLRLAESAGYDGVFQVESYPFHSGRFPKREKDALLRMLEADNVLRQYAGHLRTFLNGRSVISLSAVSSRISLEAVDIRRSKWLNWQADLIGLELARSTPVRLVSKTERVCKTTAIALVDSTGGCSKGLVLMMGGNHLPADKGLRSLAGAIQRVGGESTG
jgi:hypothetical protein